MIGFLNINKPKGISSHKVVSILRKITGIKQIGHAGTLDPVASGVLPIAIGGASRLIEYMDEDKEYEAGMYLGKKSNTYDTEGIIEEVSTKKVTIEEIKEVINKLQGEVQQRPPLYSAIHYKGKRLYELARAGEIPSDIPLRPITIYSNEIKDFDYDKQILKLRISCSKGTYIRTIVNDIGEFLQCGAVMYELIRTKSSGLRIENSINLTDDTTAQTIRDNLINPADLLNINKTEVTDEIIPLIKNGNKTENIYNIRNKVLITNRNRVIAICEADEKYIYPKKVLI